MGRRALSVLLEVSLQSLYIPCWIDSQLHRTGMPHPDYFPFAEITANGEYATFIFDANQQCT